MSNFQNGPNMNATQNVFNFGNNNMMNPAGAQQGSNVMPLLQMMMMLLSQMMAMMSGSMGNGGYQMGQPGMMGQPNFGGMGSGGMGVSGGGFGNMPMAGFGSMGQPNLGMIPTTGMSGSPGFGGSNGMGNYGGNFRGMAQPAVYRYDGEGGGFGVSQRAVEFAQASMDINESDGSYLNFTQGRREAWCSDFVNHVFTRANGGVNPFNERSGRYRSSCQDMENWAQRRGLWSGGNSAQAANAGDAIVFGDGGRARHMGIIEKIDRNGTIHTIEGNTGDRVARKSYRPGDPRIRGFIGMNEHFNRKQNTMMA